MTNERTSRRTGLAVGLTAGLISGAAAGMVLGVPGLSSAAANDTTIAAAQTYVEPTTEPTEEPAEEPTRQPQGDLLRERLDALVEDGTITAEQADAVADHLVEQAVDRFGDRGPRGRRVRAARVDLLRGQFDVVSELLGVDAETLRTELSDGATLADVAEANGVSTDELVDALVAEVMERIDAAVDAGRVDQDAVDERVADLEERITERVTTSRGDR